MKFLQILTISLILFAKLSSAIDPIINCAQENSDYTCKFFNFDITLPDYQFPPTITHTEDQTNAEVQVVFATEIQTITIFPVEIFQTFPNVRHVELIHVNMVELDKNFTNCDKFEWLDLQHNNLYKISSGIFNQCKNIIGLKFGFNKIASVSEDAFYGLPKIKDIEFDNNLLVTIGENLFKESLELDFLRLNVNLLVEIPRNLLANNSKLWFFPMENNPTLNGILPRNFMANKRKLQILYIENITLVDFPDGMFTNTSGLINLFVRDNKIVRIKSGIFDDLQALERLELQRNLIKIIENDAFLGLKSLKTLKLEDNKLKFLNSKVFKHVPKLEYLNVEGNPIIAISHDFFNILTACNDFKITIGYQNVNKSAATALYANIFQCDFYVHESNGYTCDLLDAVKTGDFPIVIDDVDQESEVVSLTASKVELTDIFIEFFNTFKTVRYVNFSNSILRDESLRNLQFCGDFCKNLWVLNLNYNNFTTIPPEVANFSSMFALFMSNNRINAVDLAAYELKILDLSSNQLKSFCDYTSESIDLSNNPMQIINPLDSVKVLNLNNLVGNEPTVVIKSAFKNAKNLKVLSMSKRNLISLNSIEFNDILEFLDISHNQIRDLNFNEASGPQNLTHLNFSNNFVAEISVENFKKLKNLEFLDLRHNFIESVAEFSFQNLTYLTDLLLDFNSIKILLKNAFFGLQNLQTLSVTNNNLKVLENEIFVSTLRLKFLNLSSNSLTSFSKAKFGEVSSLKSLDISKNEIQIVSQNFTSFFPQSTSIQMDFNNCLNPNTCVDNPKIHCNYEYDSSSVYMCEVWVARVLDPWVEYYIDGTHYGNDDSSDVTAISAESDSHMSFLPAVIFKEFPNLEILSFVRVKITFLKEFFNCHALKEVYLQGNLISSIFKELFEECPKIEVLNFENNLILKVAGDSFNKMPNLNILILAENDIRLLYPNMFDENENLEILRLNSNKIAEIDVKTFWMLKNLKNLLIHTNPIFKLPENLLSKLTKIEEFEMQSLKLNSTISVKIFQNNKKLKKLVMMKNNLTKIDKTFFENLETLEFLDLRDCEIREIHENSFKNLKLLMFLYLNDNFLESFDAKLTENLQNLVKLTLTGNKISILDENLLKYAKNLQDFQANENLIAKVPEDLLKNCQNLEILNFEQNQISSLASKSFESLKNVQIINFNYNNISEIDQKIFQNSTKLENIFFHDNKISNLPAKLFENLRKLTKIDFSKNKLTSIKFETFKASGNFLFENLQEIFLSKNSISSIETQSFKLIPNLKVLELQYNRIKSLSTNIIFSSFLNPHFMTKIDVSYNLINKISSDFFEKIHPVNFLATGNVCLDNDYKQPYLSLPKDFEKCKSIILECRIETSDLTDSKCIMEFQDIQLNQQQFDFEVNIQEIPKQSIKIVEFAFSSLAFIPSILFQDLPNLKNLIAKNVNLKNLNKLESCKNLDFLNLDGNFAIDLGDRMLENCTNLRVLSVNSVNLNSISMTTFYGLKNLKELRLESSKIANINFYVPNSLEILKLSGNFLKIDTKSFESLTNLKEIYINDYNGDQIVESFDRNSIYYLENLEILDISNRGLTVQNFPIFSVSKNNLKILKSNKNYLQDLNDQIFKNLTNLVEIHLENCNIFHISDYLFQNTLKIEVINFQNSATDPAYLNRINSLSINLLKDLKNLKTLQVSKNLISEIHENNFKNLENLTTLSLSSNKIQKIGQNAFFGLKSLEVLDLSDNLLSTELHFDIFVGLKNLKQLNLKSCNLSALPSSLINIESLEVLDISRNYITNILFAPNFYNLIHIDFSSNQITTINPKFIESIPKNATIVGSSNPCSHPNLNQKSPFNECFQNFNYLNFCGLGSSEKFGFSCEYSNFESSGSASQVVQVFSKNQPLTLEIFSIFEVFVNLSTVNFWKSSVTNLNGVRNCMNLKKFDLRLNLIENLHENLLKNCENLEKFILIKNQISFVDENSFCGLKNLKFLDLSVNLIENLDSETFIDNFRIEKLVLSHNRIVNIKSGLFMNLRDLKILKLDNNFLFELNDPKILENQSKLHEIFLNSNKLTQIDPEIFKNLNNLRYFNIEINKLTEIDFTKLNSKFLNYLDISFNNLSNILINLTKFKSLSSFIAEKNFCIDKNFDEIDQKVVNLLKNCQNKIVAKDEF